MMGPEASGSGLFTQPTYRRLPPYVIFHAGGDQTVIRAVSEDRPHRPKVDHLAGLGLRGGGRSVNHRLPAETKLGHAQWAKACLEQGSTTRLSTASVRYVPGDSAKPGGRAPAWASMTAATPRSVSSPHTAATAPKSRCRVRSGSIACSRASSSASTSAAVPTYRSETIFGLPSTQPISRRYQYGFPLITFLYRLAMNLGHRPSRGRSQAPQPRVMRENGPVKISTGNQDTMITGKLRLAPSGPAAPRPAQPRTSPTSVTVCPTSTSAPSTSPVIPPSRRRA